MPAMAAFALLRDTTLMLQSHLCVTQPNSLPTCGSLRPCVELQGEDVSLWYWLSSGLGTCQRSCGKLGSHWSSLQSAFSTLLRTQASTCAPLVSGIQVSCSSPLSPDSCPTSQGTLSSLAWTPGLGHPIWLETLTPQGEYLPVYSPFSSESPPSGTSPDLIASLTFLLKSVWIFFIASVVQESFCQFPVRIVPHVDVSLMRLSGGGGFHIFLLCHLDWFPPHLPLFGFKLFQLWCQAWALLTYLFSSGIHMVWYWENL